MRTHLVPGLDVWTEKQWLEDHQAWFDRFIKRIRWHRVKYKSGRFKSSCVTPCYTAMFGGNDPTAPYFRRIPPWLQPLVDRVSKTTRSTYNCVLVRLYLSGEDEIAWHTDDRVFLGPTPTIASLSFGATRLFELRKMVGNAWSDRVDPRTPTVATELDAGDLLVMEGSTQSLWQHRVPPGRHCTDPRINLNFRYIVPGARGQETFYKYMVYGDSKRPPSWTYKRLIQTYRDGQLPITSFFSASHKK